MSRVDIGWKVLGDLKSVQVRGLYNGAIGFSTGPKGGVFERMMEHGCILMLQEFGMM